jgi:hypothetical protein
MTIVRVTPPKKESKLMDKSNNLHGAHHTVESKFNAKYKSTITTNSTKQ